MNLTDLKHLPHKQCDSDDWAKVHINLRVLAYELIEYCLVHNLPLVITSIIRPMIKGVSKTDIHAKGRAFDVSVHGWTEKQCLDCEQYLNDNFSEKFGAISISDGKPRACVYHVGTGPHLHVQCKP